MEHADLYHTREETHSFTVVLKFIPICHLHGDFLFANSFNVIYVIVKITHN